MDTAARSSEVSQEQTDFGRQTVRELVLENPAAARVLESLGIDYCCGGSHTLADACKSANRSINEVADALEKSSTAAPEKDWRGASLTDLVQFIIDKHHGFTRTEISRLGPLIAKVAAAHGKNHPELGQVQMVFAGLAEELREHMDKEENLLFPYIIQMDEASRIKRRQSESAFGTVQNPIAMMIMEHEASGQALEKIHELTMAYVVPPDACASYEMLYQALPAFAADLHQHIHLENNILFPRAIELENGLS